MACGGRAYGYIAARDAASGEREVHPEQAETVRRIFQWFAWESAFLLQRNSVERFILTTRRTKLAVRI
jgi:hypothetical protein